MTAPKEARRYVQVAVSQTLYHYDRPFTYVLPEDFPDVQAGQQVLVPFGGGNQMRKAVVLQAAVPAVSQGKPVHKILDPQPLLSENMLALSGWMQERYFCTRYDALRLMLPVGLHQKLQMGYQLAAGFKNFDREDYGEAQWAVLQRLQKAKKPVTRPQFEKVAAPGELDAALSALIQAGCVTQVHFTVDRVGDAVSRTLRAVPDFSGSLTPRQTSVLQVLQEVGSASEKELCYFTGASKSVVQALIRQGAAEVFEQEVYRRPQAAKKAGAASKGAALSKEQQRVYEGLLRQYEAGAQQPALLYGVTGSGKTSVFMKLIEAVYQKGRGIIVMVPEISLTAQTVAVFVEAFGDAVAVFHSGLSLGERLDEWKRVQRGEAKIAVGTRSAVFAPVQNLGLIVMDEEQEHTYQSETTPRYDAREVARWRCGNEKAMCLFASATPSMEAVFLAEKGVYTFHRLEKRFGNAVLPDVELIDMNEDGLYGQSGLFSNRLVEALQENLEHGQQSILLINRRGYHTFAACKTCDEVMTCPNCSISLTYHAANHRLMCHYCGYSVPFTQVCSSCGNETVAFRGAGTQRAEEEIAKFLPSARILRLDTDAVAAKYALEKKLDAFARGEYDLMVGTQMVAKGLNFERVTLVGVVSTDQMLFSDDFRSNERTFDLLTQVVGRAGRGRYKGTAMIQTYVPENAYLSLAAQQDYFGFYRRELPYRKAMLYPPYVDLMVMGFVGEAEEQVRISARWFMEELGRLAKERYGDLPLRVLQPSPAAVMKVSNKYRYKMIIKCKNTRRFRAMLSELLKRFAQEKACQKVTAYADSNPSRIL